MPKISSVTFDLRGKEVFLAGEAVKGTWFVVVSSPVKVNYINTYLFGASYVEWRETNLSRRDQSDDKFKAHELYTKQMTSHSIKGNGEQLAAGKYKYPFDYCIPNDKVHSSFEGRHGATRWFIKIEIGLPVPYSNVVEYKFLTYLANVDIDLPLYAKPIVRSKETKISKAFGIGDAGSIKVTARLDRNGFCPGECALLTLEVLNETSKDLDQPSASVMQEVDYKGNGEWKVVTECVRTVVGSRLDKGKQQKWNNQKITIDPVPPTSPPRSSYCIKCSYYIQVRIPLPFYNGEDIKLRLPITVGTVPQNHEKRLTGQSPPSYEEIPVTDLSNSISYTPQRACSSGFQYSSKSLEFPNASYTPLTAYVLDYRPVEASGGAPQAATQKQTGQEHRAPPKSTNQKQTGQEHRAPPKSTNQKQTGQEHRAPPKSTNQKQTGQEHRAPPNSTNQKQTGQEHRPSPSAPPMAEKKH
uniref:Arrestin domain-containing protein 3-like isoform X3 n=1 Tax=Crassostrea virginica TaxID=6565 RepID=A0A8B8DMY3_CRAVI|nr:arrestin domain-containing protein 3-like isoform X3 [Crassostrea virginica]